MPLSALPRRCFVFVGAALAIPLLLCGEAWALDAPSSTVKPPASPGGAAKEADPVMAQRVRSRRGGFAMGLSLGFGVASMSGYPADATKIGRPQYYTESGVLPSSFGALWIGGALTDWFVFGIGGGGGALYGAKDQSAWSGGFLFHVDTFPLFPLGGRWRDAGLMLEAGVGWAQLSPDDAKKAALIDGAGASYIGGGVFYEGIRLGKKLNMGPYLAWNYYWMDTVGRPGVFLGWRTALYTKP